MLTEINGGCEKYSGGDTAPAKTSSGVTVSTVELKTSTPNVTRTAQIKTGFKNVSEYSRYLKGRYSYMNAGQTSMHGIPTTVSVSDAFLAKCNKDPEKAKYLEENLAAIPDCVKSLQAYTKTMPGSPVCTYCAYTIDDNGNISCMSGCTNDPDGKIARENAERKARERQKEKEKQEAAIKAKAAQKHAKEKRLLTQRRAKADGRDVWQALDRVAAQMMISGGTMLDIRI